MSTRESSSVMMAFPRQPAPAPPYSSGTQAPTRPWAAAFVRISAVYFSCSSHSSDRDVKFALAKRYAMSCNILSSSVNSKSMVSSLPCHFN